MAYVSLDLSASRRRMLQGTAGLALGAVQLCRYLPRQTNPGPCAGTEDTDADAMNEELRSPHGCTAGDGGYVCTCARIHVTGPSFEMQG